MKKSILILSLLINTFIGLGQVPKSIVKKFQTVIEFIKENNAIELSKFVEYPIERGYPIPTIKNKSEFISYYPNLFDKEFIDKLKKFSEQSIFSKNESYGLVGENFSGEIWINENGFITSINYSSLQEKNLKTELTKKEKASIHPSIRQWNENILIAKSDKLLIRIDQADKGLRYACWSNGHPMSEAPDLILLNGTEERQGTMGGWKWIFKNKEWEYVIEDVEICGDPNECGLIFSLFFNSALKQSTHLKSIY
jgi:hypothetical protein